MLNSRDTWHWYRPVLLLGLLIASPALARAQEHPDLNHLQQAQTPASVPQAGRTEPSGNEKRNLDLLRRRAEEASAKAVLLRQKRTEKNLKAAATEFQAAAKLFKAAGFTGDAAEDELQAGDIYFSLGQYEIALRAYRQVLFLVPEDSAMRCRVFSHMARTYATRGQSAQAAKYSEEALRLSAALSGATQAEALLVRGEALQDLDPTEAAELFQQAQGHFAQVGDKNGQARALLLLGYIRFRNKRADASRLAGQALQLWSEIDDPDGVAQARFALGLFAAVTGEFETAQCNYQRALPVFHTAGDKDNEAITLNGLGYVARERGDPETSLGSYQNAKAIFAAVHDDLGAVEAISGMGKTLTALQRKRELLPLFREKLRLAREIEIPALEASALADMASVYELEHRYAKAQVFYDKALSLYESEQREYGEGDVLMAMARMQLEQGRHVPALSLLQSARPLKVKTAQIEDLARIDYAMADIYRRLNRLDEARTAIEKTIAVIEAQRLKIANFDSRASYFASVYKYYSLYIQILMLLSREHPDQGLARLAFETSEKSKVRTLLDLLNSSGHGSSCDELLRKQLAPEDSGPIQAETTLASPGILPVVSLGLDEIQAEIGSDDTVLLEYALGDKKSYVWAISQKQISVHELPGADQIRKLVQSVRSALTARQALPGESRLGLKEYNQRVAKADAVYRVVGRQLSKLLLGPVSLGKARRILIVPDGPLQYIPFSALPIAQANKSQPVLVGEHEVVVLPSVSALTSLRKLAAQRTPPTQGAVILADPVFEPDDPRVRRPRGAARKIKTDRPSDLKIALRDMNESGHLDSLPGSKAEAKAIRKALSDRDVLLEEGFSATRDYILKGGLRSFRFIHFATHGIIDARHPEMSGLILSLVNERGERQDGYLRLGDVYNLKLSADLVVLSACDSALGKDLESEGTIGLPRGFLYAGARSVVASLWKVDDAAAVQFMKVFYERIQRGEIPSTALRRAQLEMSHSREWAAPFFWAAFVLQGDYQ